jgi:hypothetical protein
LIRDLSPLKIDTLVLNAGGGIFKPFFEASYDDHLNTLELNVTANLDLAYHLIPTLDPMARIQVITSHSAGLRIPNFAVYAAAKTFLTVWAQTLQMELASSGSKKRVSVICAGAMATEFNQRAGIPKMVSTPALPADVAKKCVALLDSAGTHYLSTYDWLISWVNRILPLNWTNAIVLRIQAKYSATKTIEKASAKSGPAKLDAKSPAPIVLSGGKLVLKPKAVDSATGASANSASAATTEAAPSQPKPQVNPQGRRRFRNHKPKPRTGASQE